MGALPSRPPPTRPEAASTAEERRLDLSFDVHWRVPVGCGFSGFFVEVALGYLPALAALGVNAKIVSGACDEAFLSTQLTAEDARTFRAAWVDERRLTAAQTAAALWIEHGEPCGHRTWSDDQAPGRSSNGAPGRPWRVVARAMSEGDLSRAAAACLARVDEVWVPTAWHADRFVAAGVKRSALHVLPEAVDTEFFRPDHPAVAKAVAARLRRPLAPFTFLSVFKWEGRKGWDLLLDAYWREFDQATPVRLVLKTYLPSWEPGRERALKPPPPKPGLPVVRVSRRRGRLSRAISICRDLSPARDLHEHLEMHAASTHRSSTRVLPPVELRIEDASRAAMRELYAGAGTRLKPRTSPSARSCLPPATLHPSTRLGHGRYVCACAQTPLFCRRVARGGACPYARRWRWECRRLSPTSPDQRPSSRAKSNGRLSALSPKP